MKKAIGYDWKHFDRIENIAETIDGPPEFRDPWSQPLKLLKVHVVGIGTVDSSMTNLLPNPVVFPLPMKKGPGIIPSLLLW